MTHQCEGTSFGAYIKPSKKPLQQDKWKTSYCGSWKTIILPQLLAFSTKKPAIDSFAWPSHHCVVGNDWQQENLTDSLASIPERKDSFRYRPSLDETTQWKLLDKKERLHQYYQLEYWKFLTQSVGNLRVKLKKESTVSPERWNYFRRVGPKNS